MKKFTFLEIANAFRWMYDNTSGVCYLFNFNKFDVIIVKRDQTSYELSKMTSVQVAEFAKKDPTRFIPQWASFGDFWKY